MRGFDLRKRVIDGSGLLRDSHGLEFYQNSLESIADLVEARLMTSQDFTDFSAKLSVAFGPSIHGSDTK